MNRFVLDASVTLAWLIDQNVHPTAVRIQQLLIGGDRAVVPSIWPLEVANGFVTAERRGFLTEADTSAILRRFEMLVVQSIEIRSESLPIRRAAASARASGLTSYDAAYLELARQEQLPLATLDQSLSRAAQRAGVALLA